MRRVVIWTTVLDLAGVALVVAGVAMVCVPAALVVAGLGLLAASWSTTRGGAA